MDEQVLIKFGAKVRQYRNARSLSQDKLASETGLSRSYISGVERGEKNISLLNIAAISFALRISIMDLVSEV